MRALTDVERSVIQQIASKLPEVDRLGVEADLEHTRVNDSSNESLIRFDIAGYERPPYAGQRAFWPEGSTIDADGAALTIMLFVDQNDRLLELEIIRWGSGCLIDPQWQHLKVMTELPP